jgi:hypothetical protein
MKNQNGARIQDGRQNVFIDFLANFVIFVKLLI